MGFSGPSSGGTPSPTTGTGNWVRATAPTIATPTFTGTAAFNAGLANTVSMTLYSAYYGIGIDATDLTLWAQTAGGIRFRGDSVAGTQQMRVVIGTGVIIGAGTIAAGARFNVATTATATAFVVNDASGTSSFKSGTANTQAFTLFSGAYGVGMDANDIVVFTYSGGGVSFKDGSSGTGGYDGTRMMRVMAAGVVIGTPTTPNARALLDITSTAKGFLPPRMTTTQRDAVAWVSGDAGMKIHNTTLVKEQMWNGTAWETVTSA